MNIKCTYYLHLNSVQKKNISNHSLVRDNVDDEDELDDELDADSRLEFAALNLGIITCIDLR